MYIERRGEGRIERDNAGMEEMRYGSRCGRERTAAMGLLTQKQPGGLTGYVFPLMLLMIVTLLVTYTFRQRLISYGRIQLEDALTDAVLAAAVVDLDLFGGNEYRIENYDYADLYAKFRASLSQGLHLDENGMPEPNSWLASGITVEEFWIYNMERDTDGKIVAETLCRYISGGSWCNLTDRRVNESAEEIPRYFPVTPNEKTVNSLTIYARIAAEIKGVWGSTYAVAKEQAADVAKN